MKFAAYLALVGTASAAACSNDATVAALKVKTDAKTAYDAALALKTADVTAYEAKMAPLKKHVVEMTDALSALLKTRTYTTEQKIAAETNLGAAVKARDALLAEANSTAYHKILVDIDSTKATNDKAIESELRALAACLPTAVKTYLDTAKAARQLKVKYSEFTTEKKAAWDKKYASRIQKFMEEDATARYHSKYSAMTDAEKTMYDNIVIAQIKGREAKMDEFDALVEKSKTRDGWANMTIEEKKRFQNGFNMMFDDDDKRKFQYRMDDDDARTRAGYFTKMNTSQRAVFDGLRKKLNSARDADDKKFMADVMKKKIAAGFDKMDPSKQRDFMKGVMQYRDKMTSQRDANRRMDDDARAKGGYFSMSEAGRKDFDAKRMAFNKARSGLGNMMNGKKGYDDRGRSYSPDDRKQYSMEKMMSYNQKGGNSMGGMDQKQQYQMMELMGKMKNQGGSGQDMQSMREKLNWVMNQKGQVGGKQMMDNMSDNDWSDLKSKFAGMKGQMSDKTLSPMMKKGDGSAGSPCGLQGGMNGRGPPGQGGMGGMGRKLQGMDMLKGLLGDDDDDRKGGGKGQCQQGLCCGTVKGKQGYPICAPKWGKSYQGSPFTCMQGAQNLAASAMALITVSYMMA